MKKYRNRGIGRSGTDALTSGRIGVGGIRTFHVNFSSRKVGTSVAGLIDYVAAEGDYEGRDDLEGKTENLAEFRRAIDAIDAAAKVRKGPTAERVLCSIVTELPSTFDQSQRIEAAERLVEYWEAKGHSAIVAIHGNGKVQPHLHLAISARPVTVNSIGQIVVNRDTKKRPFNTKKQIYGERQNVAWIINDVAGREVFHPGRLADTGIDRMPKRRLTVGEYKAGVNATKNAEIVALQRIEYERRKAEAKKRAVSKRREKYHRRIERVKAVAGKCGLKALNLQEQIDLQNEGAKKGFDAAMQKARDQVRAADQEPATGKQVAYLLDLARLTASSKAIKAKIDKLGDLELTKGWAGEQIRRLQEIQREGVQSRAHKDFNGL